MLAVRMPVRLQKNKKKPLVQVFDDEKMKMGYRHINMYYVFIMVSGSKTQCDFHAFFIIKSK
jgi:hypothetical protein